MGIFMLSYSVLVTAVYVLNKNPIFHEVHKNLFLGPRWSVPTCLHTTWGQGDQKACAKSRTMSTKSCPKILLNNFDTFSIIAHNCGQIGLKIIATGFKKSPEHQ